MKAMYLLPQTVEIVNFAMFSAIYFSVSSPIFTDNTIISTEIPLVGLKRKRKQTKMVTKNHEMGIGSENDYFNCFVSTDFVAQLPNEGK